MTGAVLQVLHGIAADGRRRADSRARGLGNAALDGVLLRDNLGLWAAIGRIIDTFTPTECANYFAAAGYDAD